MRVGNSIAGARRRRLWRVAFSINGRKSKLSSSSALRKVCSTSSKARGSATAPPLVSHTRKTLSTTLSPRGKTSALKILIGTIENDPAILASNRSRSHVQKLATLCPCSGRAFHCTAAASGCHPGLKRCSTNERNNFRCSTISGTSLPRK